MKKYLNKLKWLIISTAILAFPHSANAQGFTKPQTWEGVCVHNGVATVQGLRCLIANILSVAVTAIGFIGFIMIIVGAFRYLISGGNSKDTQKAKNTLTFAVIGLIVALSAFVILNLIAEFTGIKTILNFNIPDAGVTFN